jgi:hypothetical protein
MSADVWRGNKELLPPYVVMARVLDEMSKTSGTSEVLN